MPNPDYGHLGHMILDCFRKRPNAICVIDAATGLSVTNAEMASRSIRFAQSLKQAGFVPGDVLALSGRNHVELHIPYYAALFNGLTLFGVDPLYKFDEIKNALRTTTPKIAVCEPEDYETYFNAIQDIGLDAELMTFGNGEHSMNEFIKNSEIKESEESFEAATFQLDKTLIWLISTSGTTGKSKVAAFDHLTFLQSTIEYNAMSNRNNKIEVKDNTHALNLSPIQWISGMFNPVGMPLRSQCMVQTSAPPTTSHIIDIINEYKPVQVLVGPSTLSYILKHEKQCDLTCFQCIIICGGKVDKSLLERVKEKMRSDAVATQMYGQTETLGPVFYPSSDAPPESCGKPFSKYQTKLVNQENGQEITEPFTFGELWLKGNTFKEYYKDPEETAKVFSDDGWYKSGDLLYRDEENNYYYVDRLKSLIKYQNYHILPSEIEEVITSHPDVFDAVVTGVPHADDGERAVACVVTMPDTKLTAQDIHQLVASKLSEKKQLRGGVIFLDKIPLTSNGKISLADVNKIVRSHSE